jgi:hypothetical protein
VYREVVLHSSELRPRKNSYSKLELRGLSALCEEKGETPFIQFDWNKLSL